MHFKSAGQEQNVDATITDHFLNYNIPSNDSSYIPTQLTSCHFLQAWKKKPNSLIP